MVAIALLFRQKTAKSSAGVKGNSGSSDPERSRIGSDLKTFILNRIQGSLRLMLAWSMSLFWMLLDGFLSVGPMREAS